MAVQNLVSRIENWIANYDYSALRTAAHQTRHTSIRYSLDWMIDGVAQMINEASHNSVGNNPNIDQANLRTVIGAKWSTVITKRNFSRWVQQDGNLPTPTFYSLAAAEASSGQKANDAPSGTDAAIALELEGGDIVLTALNCYRYQHRWG